MQAMRWQQRGRQLLVSVYGRSSSCCCAAQLTDYSWLLYVSLLLAI